MHVEAAINSLLAAGDRLANLLGYAKSLPRNEALGLLARYLDEIAVAYHDVPDCPPDDREVEAAGHEFPDFAATVGDAFPELGEYWCASQSSDDPSSEILMIGDANGDLSEILGELAAIRWRSEYLTPTAAAFYANLMQGHTLSHLFELRRNGYAVAPRGADKKRHPTAACYFF